MKLSLILLCLFPFIINAQNSDYSNYYTLINKAEKRIFVDSAISDGLSIYLYAFNAYDFVFLTDCITAMQIALYAKDENYFLKFSLKGFQNGLLPRHLSKINYIKHNQQYVKNLDTLIEMYKRNRPAYFKRIDTITLKKMISLYVNDQKFKNSQKNNVGIDEKSYKLEIQKTISSLREIITNKGFPTEKIIGVDQNDIMKELNLHNMDVYEYFNLFKRYYNVTHDQFIFDERSFSSTYIFPIFHHYESSFGKYDLFEDSFYLAQILNGNLHPKDFAYINDIKYRVDETHKPNKQEMFFGGGWMDKQYLLLNDSIINKFRIRFFLPPIQQDRMKYGFMTKQGMWTYLGYMGTRI